jgi:hypothetical protein
MMSGLRRPPAAANLFGGTLKAPLPSALLTATALLIAGCSGPGEPAATQPSAEATKPAGAEEKKVSLDDTCLELFGHTTLAVDTITFLTDVSSLDADTARQADSFDAKLGEVAATAQPELAEPLQDMQVVFQDFSQAWEDRGNWELDTASYGAAKGEISRICTPRIHALASGPASATPALTDDERFLEALRTAHPAMKSTDTANQLEVAKIFCDLYGTAVAKGTQKEAAIASDGLVTAPAGIEYTHEELKSIRKIGVTTFCPQHLSLVP